MKKIKWGIIGCGNIAHKFANDLKLVESAELTAVASRSIKKANVFGEKHEAKKNYGSYIELLNDSEVDIVYIATPHTSHAELSILAMEHGKHVLCETPLAINKKDAAKMITTSKRINCFFMEALWTRFNPVFVEVLKRIKNGEIGDVDYINADFAFKSDHAQDSRVFDLDIGGGALLDIGIYPAFLTYAILGKPKKIQSSSRLHEVTGCDIQTSMIFEYEKAQAILYSGFTSKSDMTARISGTEGQIYINDRWHHTSNFTLVKNDIEEAINIELRGYGYVHEILECHQCLENGALESELWSHQNSLDLISILDSVRNQIGLKYPQD